MYKTYRCSTTEDIKYFKRRLQILQVNISNTLRLFFCDLNVFSGRNSKEKQNNKEGKDLDSIAEKPKLAGFKRFKEKGFVFLKSEIQINCRFSGIILRHFGYLNPLIGYRYGRKSSSEIYHDSGGKNRRTRKPTIAIVAERGRLLPGFEIPLKSELKEEP